MIQAWVLIFSWSVGAHLLGCGTGRTGLGTGPQTAEGPWSTVWLCTAEGLLTRRELLGSAGRGFWGGLGFSSSWQTTDTVTENLQQVALTVRPLQLRSWPCPRLPCMRAVPMQPSLQRCSHVVLILSFHDEDLLPSPHLVSIHFLLFSLGSRGAASNITEGRTHTVWPSDLTHPWNWVYRCKTSLQCQKQIWCPNVSEVFNGGYWMSTLYIHEAKCYEFITLTTSAVIQRAWLELHPRLSEQYQTAEKWNAGRWTEPVW